MNCWIFRLGLSAVAVFLINNMYGQRAPAAEDLAPAPAFKQAVGLYNQKMKNQALIYNGPEYHEPNVPSSGHPYFMEDFMENGTINYEGEIYTDIPMLYDVSRDRIIIEHFDQSGVGVQLIPHKERILGFLLYDRRFVHLTTEIIGQHMRPGFYDVLYDKGGIRALVKHRKEPLETVSQGGVLVSYEPKDQYFIFRDGQYFSVKAKSGLLRALKDEKKTLTQFMKKNVLSFRQNKERVIVAVVEYYDKLKQHE